MNMYEVNSASVAIYPDHEQAEAAVAALQHGGFDMTKLSIVGANYHSEEHAVGVYNTGERMKSWGKNGAFWGSVWGVLSATGFFFLPGIGPLLVGGPLVVMLVSGLEGAAIVGGVSALGAGLIGLGIPKVQALKYEMEIKAGSFMVVAAGSRIDTDRARDIIAQAGLGNSVLHTSAI
jgi:hypothetical protein